MVSRAFGGHRGGIGVWRINRACSRASVWKGSFGRFNPRLPEPSTPVFEPGVTVAKIREFESLEQVNAHLADGGSFAQCAFQGLDLSLYRQELKEHPLTGCLFLGCRLPEDLLPRIHRTGALVFPDLTHVPFTVYRPALYDAEELILNDYVIGEEASYEKTLDAEIFDYYVRSGRTEPESILDSLTRRMHDHAVTDALHEFIVPHRAVAVMGGHGLSREDPHYALVAEICHRLSRRGFLMVSGGGPGAMEAANLGAWFAERPRDALSEAILELGEAPYYEPIGPWLDTAARVRSANPRSEEELVKCPSLAIPTWHYGHEPPNLFATHIAKYFANSVREEGLLAIAKHGVIFSPGSAGTIQEIFQDAAQNHYRSFGGPSPMLFLGEEYWTKTKPVYPLLKMLAAGRDYEALLSISDSPDAIVDAIVGFAVQNPDL